jgi:hypothetical protein
MSKSVLKTKKVVKLPATAGSIVISFRAVKRKGAVKNTRKVSVPRRAEQVCVHIRKTRATTPKTSVAKPKKTAQKLTAARRKQLFQSLRTRQELSK